MIRTLGTTLTQGTSSYKISIVNSSWISSMSVIKLSNIVAISYVKIYFVNSFSVSTSFSAGTTSSGSTLKTTNKSSVLVGDIVGFNAKVCNNVIYAIGFIYNSKDIFFFLFSYLPLIKIHKI